VRLDIAHLNTLAVDFLYSVSPEMERNRIKRDTYNLSISTTDEVQASIGIVTGQITSLVEPSVTPQDVTRPGWVFDKCLLGSLWVLEIATSEKGPLNKELTDRSKWCKFIVAVKAYNPSSALNRVTNIRNGGLLNVAVVCGGD
jgi:hypothetical protein